MAELPENLQCYEGYFHDGTFEYPDLPEALSEALTEPLENTLIMDSLSPSRFTVFWHGCVEAAKEIRESVRPHQLRPYAVQLGLGGAAIVTGVAVALFSSHETSDAPQALPHNEQPTAVQSHAPHPKRQKTSQPTQHPTHSPTHIPTQNLAWPSATANQPLPDWAQSPSIIVVQPSSSQPAEATASESPSSNPTTEPTPSETKTETATPPVTESPPASETPDNPVASTPTNNPSTSASASASESSAQSAAPSESLLSTSAGPETPPISVSPSLGD